MNERNVEALTDCLIDIRISVANRACFRRFAEKLAVLGVLAPSALTDEEARRAWEAASDFNEAGDPSPSFEVPDLMRRELGRIAKGEDA